MQLDVNTYFLKNKFQRFQRQSYALINILYSMQLFFEFSKIIILKWLDFHLFLMMKAVQLRL